jgi:transposase InsO family protein
MGRRAVGVDLKLALAVSAPLPRGSVSQVCRELGISRDTYYEAKKRFDAEGVTGLLPRSRRPHSSPNQTRADLEEAIVRARKELADEGWDNGARSIAYRLEREGVRPPAVSTIHAVLRRRGLVADQPQKRPRSATRRFEFSAPNSCWQMDGTEWKLADGSKAVIIGVIDDHTRRSLGHYAARGETGEAVWACFLNAVNNFGLPVSVLTDNGTSFNARRRGWEVDFTRNLTALGVTPMSSGNHHPQTCGKRERLNGTVKRWLAKQPPANTLADLQAQLTMFDRLYDERPNQSLAGLTPAERWQRAVAANPPDTASPAPVIVKTSTVDSRGSVAIGARFQVHVGRPWAGTTMTVISQGLSAGIFHGNTLVRELTLNPSQRYQPSGRPRGGRRQRRILSAGQ